MSKTIDERVVEMRFDNSNFENNVKTSMSTLERLKRALKFDGASKGLDNIQSSANKVNFSGMTKGIETVNAKFSYMQATIQHQLNNIVDSAVNAGKRMVSALTIDPIKSGFQEYETQINAVQTILANTQKEGTTVETVNKALDELNTYADKTIYNFTEMTRNIGTFTAAGVKLDTSVKAIQGIANLAAVSGSTSQQASMAMYQLSQALAAGKVQLMDWNSVVNAGMGGQVFQDALIRTSELLGTGAKQAIATAGSFRESLTESGWLTTEVLTETLNQLSGAYTKADLLAQGYSEDQADEIVKLAQTAEDAATKVKTFTQLWDVMKEAAQSGWAQTWRIIVGDFEEAKELLTPLADFFTDIIGKFSDSRNKVLEGALSGNPFTKLAERIEKVTGATEAMKEATQDYGEIVDKVIRGDFGNGQARFDKLAESGYNWAKVQNMVNEKLGNSYRYTVENDKAQKNLNETQKTTIEDLVKMSDAQLKNLGFTKSEIQAFRDLQEQSEKTGIPIKDLIKDLDQLNGRTLLINSFKNIGKSLLAVFTEVGKAWKEVFWGNASDDEIIQKKSERLYNLIAGFHKFTTYLKVTDETADKLKRTFKGVFAVLDIVSTLTGGALKTGFKILSTILGAFDINILDITASIGDMIVSFRDWLLNNNALAKAVDGLVEKLPGLIDKLKEWWAGFKETPAVERFVELVERIKKAFSVLSTMEFNSDSILHWIKSLKDDVVELVKSIPAIVKQLFSDIVSGIDGLTGGAITKLKKFLSSIPITPEMEAFAEAIARLRTGISEIISNIESVASDLWNKATEWGKNIIEGIQNGLGDGIGDVVSKILEVATNLINAFCDMLGIHSPSTVAFEWGQNIIEGLVNGISSGIQWVVDGIALIGSAIVDIFKNVEWEKITGGLDVAISKFKELIDKVPWDKLLTIIPIAAALYMVKKIYDVASALAEGINSLNGVIDGLTDIEQSFSKVLKSYALNIKADALKKVATAIAILVGSVIALTFVDPEKLYNAVVAVGLLAGILALLALAMNKMSEASMKIGKNGVNLDGIKTGLISIGVALLLLAATAKIMGSLDTDQLKQGFIGLTGLIVEMGVFLVACGLIAKKGDLKNIDKIGSMMIKLSVAMLLMVGVVKLASGLSADEVMAGVAFAAAFAIFVRSITAVAKSAGNNVSKVGGMMIKLSVAMGLMVLVVKMIGLLNAEDMIQGAVFASAFVLFVKTLVSVTKIGKNRQIAKLGGLLLSMSVSLLLMVGVCKLVGMLSVEELVKGSAFLLGFIGFIKLLVKVTEIGSEQKIAKVAGTILAMSMAIGILAGVSILMSMVSVEGLLKGVTAVSALGLVMAAMVKATQGSSKAVGNIVALTVAVGIMAATIAALTLIDSEKLAVVTASLGSLMGMFALMTKMASGASVSIKALASMTVVVGLLAGLLWAMDELNVTTSIETVGSLSVLLLTFAASLRIINGCNEISSSALIVIGALTLVVAGLAAILGVLAYLDVEPSIQTATSLSILLIGLSTSALILSKMGMIASGAATGAAEMILVVAGVAAILTAIAGLIAMIPGAQEFLENGIPVLEAIGNGLGSFLGGFIGGIGEGITDSLPAISENIRSFVENFSGIDSGALEGAKAAVGVIAAIAGANVMDFISRFLTFGQDPMQTFKTNLVGFAETMSEVSAKLSENPINQEAITAAANAGSAMAELQGSIEPMFGLAQALTGIKSLGTFGEDISAYGEALVAASKALTTEGGAIAINKEAITAAAEAGTAMATLQGSIEPMFGLAQVLTGAKSLTTFGADIMMYANALKDASKALTTEGGAIAINKEAITAAAEAGTSMATLQGSIEPMFGLAQVLTGVKDLGTFGENIKTYGSALKEASKALSGEDGGSVVNQTAIDAAVNAGRLMTELQKAIPEDHWFDGKVSLDDFGSKIESFGSSMSSFSEAVAEFDPSKVGSSISAANRLVSFVESISDIDLNGVTVFKGGIGNGPGIPGIASALTSYSDKLSEFDAGKVSSSITSANRLKNFISSLSGLDSSGIENFKVGSIGKTLKSYANSVSEMKVGVVASSISAANQLRNFIASLAGLDSSSVSNFELSSIGSAMKSYAGSVSEINMEQISTSISAATKLKNFISSLSGLDTSGVKSFKSAVSSLGQINIGEAASSLSKSASKFSSVGSDMISSLTKGVTSKSSNLKSTMSNLVTSMVNAVNSKRSAFSTSGSQLMTHLISGLSSKRSNAVAMVGSIATSAASAARSSYSSFYSSGSYLGAGLVIGINSQRMAAYMAGYALGQAAAQGEKDGQKSNSPSKLTIQAGKWLGEGLVIGINKMTSEVYKAGYGLGNSAVGSISSTIAKVSDYVNKGLEAEPTIRPIMDLSDIESGVGAINGMFNKRLSLGTVSNINAIGSMMRNSNQNGSNADVVSAINKLRKDLGNIGGNTYNVNGVTYDDGSNISDAVKTLIRAAKVERRM